MTGKLAKLHFPFLTSQLETYLGPGVTIVDLTRETPVVLRPGSISVQQIGDLLLTQFGESALDRPRVPGSLESHYAPGMPLKIVHADEIENYLRGRAGAPVAVLSRRARPRDSKATLWQVAPELPDDYARLLYGTLRRLDVSGCRLIIVEALPALPEWTAIRDRLGRAAMPGPRRCRKPRALRAILKCWTNLPATIRRDRMTNRKACARRSGRCGWA